MGRALVLNASDSPLAVVPARRAVVLVLKEKAEVIVSNGMVFRSATISMEAPSVVRLRRYVRVPYRPHAPLTRRAVFARDEWTCQYCTAPAENLDHVIPRSRGGTHTWENVVAACRRCNAKKENRTPQEAGFAPGAPAVRAHRRLPTDPRPARARLGGLPRRRRVIHWRDHVRHHPADLADSPSPHLPQSNPPFRCPLLTQWSDSGIKVDQSGGKGRRALWPSCSARTAIHSTPRAGCRCLRASATRSRTASG